MYGDPLDIGARRLRSKILKRLARQGWAKLVQIPECITLWFRHLGKRNPKHGRDTLMSKVSGQKPKFERLKC